MKTGITLAKFDWPGNPEKMDYTLKKIIKKVEESGFDSVWVMDHFYQLPGLGEIDDEMYEGYSLLSFLAGVTEKVRLGTLVTGIHYRNPGFLVKQVTTLDVLSGGRAYFGVGAGWFERESKGLGFEFGTFTDRFEKLEEALQISKQMWANDRSMFKGKHYQMEEPICSPLPLQKPHPPIMIGGGGEKKTLKMVAKYGDACNLFVREGVDMVKHKLEVLRGHCEDVGRDYSEIEKTVLMSIDLSEELEEPMDVCNQLSQVGIDHVIFRIEKYWELAPLKIMGKKVIPELNKI